MTTATLYAGPYHVLITDTATFDGAALLPGSVASIVITIYDRDGVAVVNATAMTWDAPKARWEYLWNTAGLDAGTYKAKVVIVTLDGASAPGWKRIRLACDA